MLETSKKNTEVSEKFLFAYLLILHAL